MLRIIWEVKIYHGGEMNKYWSKVLGEVRADRISAQVEDLALDKRVTVTSTVREGRTKHLYIEQKLDLVVGQYGGLKSLLTVLILTAKQGHP